MGWIFARAFETLAAEGLAGGKGTVPETAVHREKGPLKQQSGCLTMDDSPKFLPKSCFQARRRGGSAALGNLD